MNLFLLRHAKAAARGPKYRIDSQRPLTQEGEKIMRQAAAGLKALELSFDSTLASPSLRALRTAEILADVMGSKKLIVTDHLAPDANPADLVAEIADAHCKAKNLLLVGHEPFLSRLASVLLTGEAVLEIDFKKAALCKLNIERLCYGKCASLGWLMTPRQMSRLRKRA